VIRIEKHTFYQIVLERPNDILGSIWFGNLPGYPPFVSLRLSRALDIMVRPYDKDKVCIPKFSPGASSVVTGKCRIKLEIFMQLIQRDGFGELYWNDCGNESFVTMTVIAEGLLADFIAAVE